MDKEKKFVTKEITRNKISKLFGPKIDRYEDLTKNEKCLVSNCFRENFFSKCCYNCRFLGVCENNQHMC